MSRVDRRPELTASIRSAYLLGDSAMLIQALFYRGTSTNIV